MGTSDRPVSEPTQGATSGRALLLATFTAAIILSAALLFMVQPMFTKLVLPRFGGAPAVWSVAIVFFQTALLAGYAYAHWLTRYASGRLSVALHLVVMLAAVFALPPAIASGWERPPAGTEPLWLIALFAISVESSAVTIRSHWFALSSSWMSSGFAMVSSRMEVARHATR